MRQLLIGRHQTNTLTVLAARHVQMRELVHAPEWTGHVALHRRAQRHGTGAIVSADMRIRRGRTLVDGDVDAMRAKGGGRRCGTMSRQHGGVQIAMALRRETRRLALVDVCGQRQRRGQRIIAFRGAMEAGGGGICEM